MPSNRRGRPTVGVLVGWQVYEVFLHSYVDYAFRGIRSAADDLGCNLLLACGTGHVTVQHGGYESVPHPAWPVLTPDTDFVPVGPWNTDGIVAVAPLLSEERSRYVRDLASGGHPVVFAGEGEGGPAVVADVEGGIAAALAHLAWHGHRRVAFFDAFEEENPSVRARYLETGRELGMEMDPDLVVYGHNSIGGGEAAMRRLLAAGTSFTAVVARNDESALGAMRVLREAGLRIPADVAVIGFDDRPEAAAEEPPLTSVHVPVSQMGYRALALLLGLMAGEAEGDEIVRVATHLIIRESCGCSPGAGEVARDVPRLAAGPGDLAGGPDRSLPEAMAEAVLRETQSLAQEDVQPLCRRLAETFAAGLEQDDAVPFRLAVQDVLLHAKEAGDSPHAWQSAVSILEEWHASALASSPGLYPRLARMLRQVRVAISAGVHHQYMRYVIDRHWLDDQASLLTTRLLGAVDEEQVYQVLGRHLPGIGMLGFGIQHAAVASYEAEGDDPVAWSVLRAAPDRAGLGVIRFPSRDFPPPGVYSADRPFSLALLPLIVEGECRGFVAFEGTNLGLCAILVWQLAAAFRSVELYREAVEARRLAEEANRLKSRFLSTVSHELRTPLNLVVGLSEMLLAEQAEGEAAPTESFRQDLERIHAGAQHLDGLIRDVLDLARSDVGRLRLVFESLDLAETLAPVIAAGEQLTREKKLAWRVEIEDDLPRVRGDRTRLRQVALNLVSNAVKFTAKGEVALECRLRNADCGAPIADRKSPIADRGSRSANRTSHIADRGSQIADRTSPIADGQLPTTDGNAPRDKRLATSDLRPALSEAAVITISVSDTGLGIPPSELDTIFDEFHQSERTATRGYGGLGLGLAVCRRLVDLHGGDIWAESPGEVGGGSVFTFALPAEEAPAVGADEARDRGRTVLLLGGQAGGRLRERLVWQGFDVEVEEPTDDGIEDTIARLQAAPPGAVVLDAEMASRLGWKVMTALKENPATHQVPVLFCALERDDSGALLDMDYLTKPVGSAELAQALLRRGIEGGEDEGASTILVVDDEPGILEMHCRIVQAQLPESRVLQARNGREALDVMQQERPDLVLLDLMMPELDGFGVLEAMQAGETMHDVPVIVLTGQALTEEDMERLNRGVVAVLGKGLFNAQETLAHVEQALQRSPRLGSAARRTVRRAMAYVHEHYADPVTRGEIAYHLGVSKGHLSRSFHQEMGVTPRTYLNRYRVNRAKELLATGGGSVTEVAMAVGFSDAAYFSRVFRREVGTSPTAFRRAAREEVDAP